MSLQKIIILCLAILVIGIAIWYFISGKNSPSAELTNDNSSAIDSEMSENNQDKMEAPSGLGSLASLIGLGQNITCDYSFSDEGNSGSGTGYFAKDKMRVDSTMQTDGQTYDSHMINDGEYTYVWTTTSDQPFAMKMPVEEFEQDSPLIEEDSQQTQVSMDQQVEYDCNSWSVDQSVFVPPADIEFTDMEAMMKQMMGNIPEGFEMPEGIPTTF
ncbi:hypothetical protein KC723_03140 [Candidatus Kaiserbacteria bacterium]|nr:hypothetical protein [Candidatus Kaiserbacteria bacterium]